MQRDPVLALPLELVTHCFGWLGLRSRIAISHVSWLWRNTALSNRSLWNEYTVSDYSGRVDWQAGLTALLLRSDPAPFRLDFWCWTDLSDALVQLLMQHMHRMRWLGLNHVRRDAVLRLLDQDAPILEGITHSWCPDPVAPVNLTWLDLRAPRLREVQLGTFMITEDCVFSAMHSFTGRLTNEYPLLRPLVHVFPNLSEVNLRGITEATLAFLLPLPPTVTSVTLLTDGSEPIDYSNFLRGCESASLSVLTIGSASSITPAVHYFTRKVQDQWELHLLLQGHMRLCAPDVKYTVHCHGRLSFTREPKLASVLHRVAKLSLTLTDYADLYRSFAWPRVFPALTQLALDVRMWGRMEITARPTGSTCKAAPIEAPVLESVFFKVYGYGRSPLLAIPHIPPVVRSLAGARLENLILFAEHPQHFVDADLSSLAGLGLRLSICNMGGVGMRRFEYDNDVLGVF